MRIVLVIVATLLLASPCSAGYRVRGYVVYQGQRILIVKRVSPRRSPVRNADPLDRRWRELPGGDTRSRR